MYMYTMCMYVYIYIYMYISSPPLVHNPPPAQERCAPVTWEFTSQVVLIEKCKYLLMC